MSYITRDRSTTGARHMIRLSTFFPNTGLLITGLLITGLNGCSVMSSSTSAMEQPAFAVASMCVPLGALTARVDCDCYDKMSYDKVRFEAKENLHLQARTSYPESNRVEVSSVDLYMNSAVAKGTAYRCPVVGSS